MFVAGGSKADEIQASREWLQRHVDKARRDPEWRAQLRSDPEKALQGSGLNPRVDPRLVSAEIERRASLDDEMQAVRSQLDEISDEARLNPELHKRLLADPESFLTAHGLKLDDAAAVARELQGDHDHVEPSWCSFTCCRHPATDWCCDPSILV